VDNLWNEELAELPKQSKETLCKSEINNPVTQFEDKLTLKQIRRNSMNRVNLESSDRLLKIKNKTQSMINSPGKIFQNKLVEENESVDKPFEVPNPFLISAKQNAIKKSKNEVNTFKEENHLNLAITPKNFQNVPKQDKTKMPNTLIQRMDSVNNNRNKKSQLVKQMREMKKMKKSAFMRKHSMMRKTSIEDRMALPPIKLNENYPIEYASQGSPQQSPEFETNLNSNNIYSSEQSGVNTGSPLDNVNSPGMARFKKSPDPKQVIDNTFDDGSGLEMGLLSPRNDFKQNQFFEFNNNSLSTPNQNKIFNEYSTTQENKKNKINKGSRRRTTVSKSKAKDILRRRKTRANNMNKKMSQKNWMQVDESINIHTLNLSNYNKINLTNNMVREIKNRVKKFRVKKKGT
jgi:hypothetical protein